MLKSKQLQVMKFIFYGNNSNLCHFPDKTERKGLLKKQTLLVMKLVVLLLTITSLQLSAKSYAQQVTLQVNNASLGEVLEQIYEQTGYQFVATKAMLKKAHPVSIHVKDAPLKEALNICFTNQPITYLIKDRAIIVKQKATREDKGSEISTLPQIHIHGTVTDAATGSQLVGVTIQVKGGTTGTTTNSKGNFSLDAPDNAVLIVSYLGYTTKEINVKGTEMHIELAAASTALNQLVVVGYGTQKKADLTGAISQISISKQQKLGNANVLQDLHGQVPGLNIGAVTTAGSDPFMSVRGQNTFSNSQADRMPLIVLDGIIYRGDLTDLNPFDIQSVTVLKDASAEAIYGSQASNGVILITTKKGTNNSGKPVISFSSQYSYEIPSNTLKPLQGEVYKKFLSNVYWSQAFLPPEYTAPNQSFSIANVLKTNALTQGFEDGVNNDWWGLLTGNGYLNSQNLSVSNKNENTDYFISLGYTKQKGFIINDKYKRINVRANFDARITDWLKFGFESFLSSNSYPGQSPSVSTAFEMQPFAPIKDSTGKYVLQPEGTNLNPFLQIQEPTSNKILNLFGNFHLDIGLPFLPGFNYRINYSNNYITSNQDQFNQWGDNFLGSGYKNASISYDWTLDNIFSYNRDIGENSHIDLTFVYGAEKDQSSFTNATALDFVNPLLGYNFLQAGSPSQNIITTGASQSTSLYSMGRLSYIFKNKYLLTATARRDGFSGFGTDKKIGVFPSVGLGWVISDEKFYRINFINYLKLRASYGSTGRRAVAPYQTLAQVSSGPARVFGNTGTASIGQYVSTMANNNLGWETTTGINIGADFDLLRSRIKGDIEYYQTTTRNILYTIQIPNITGFSTISSNIGKVHNHGVEVSVNANIIQNGDFSWNASANFTLNRNKIMSILGPDSTGKEQSLVSSDLFIGKPINVIYNYKVIGMWQLTDKNIPNGFLPGTYKLALLNGDTAISPNDKKILGYTDPSFTLGIGNTFRYKNFSLYFFVYTMQGGKHYFYGDDSPYGDADYVKQDQLSYSVPPNFDYWTPQNTHAKYRRLDIPSAFGGQPYDQRNFIRLQSLSLSYAFSSKVLEKYKIRSLDIYVSGTNLLTLTKWQGWDPETGVGLVPGLPVMKSYTAGLNIQL
jgi:TonB-linked SusC/RagA family outer membrane protein